jgi:hypothetical protein
VILGSALLLTITGAMIANEPAATSDSDAAMKALQDIQDLIGVFEGSGLSDVSKGWSETMDGKWKFNKNGRVSLYFHFAQTGEKSPGRLVDEAMITYDPEKKAYIFRAYKAGDKSETALIEFVGNRKQGSERTLRFTRTNKGNADDKLDQLDIMVLNDGDRINYLFYRRVGTSNVYRSYARVSLDRQGTSIAGSAAKGPKCIITGGPGTMAVAYQGKTYYVCCTGCRDAFLAQPEKYLAKLTDQ